tara:strand:+ start:603 stop:728 length:126 start_codon:yes stop_codon:yes gene_type:complete
MLANIKKLATRKPGELKRREKDKGERKKIERDKLLQLVAVR